MERWHSFSLYYFLFLLYFSARINYRDAPRSEHTKDNGSKILKSVFGEVFLLEEISLEKGWRVGEVTFGAAESRINACDVCAAESLCQVSTQLKGNVWRKLVLRFKVEGSNESRKVWKGCLYFYGVVKEGVEIHAWYVSTRDTTTFMQRKWSFCYKYNIFSFLPLRSISILHLYFYLISRD
jgi:hypothetical protein